MLEAARQLPVDVACAHLRSLYVQKNSCAKPEDVVALLLAAERATEAAQEHLHTGQYLDAASVLREQRLRRKSEHSGESSSTTSEADACAGAVAAAVDVSSEGSLLEGRCYLMWSVKKLCKGSNPPWPVLSLEPLVPAPGEKEKKQVPYSLAQGLDEDMRAALVDRLTMAEELLLSPECRHLKLKASLLLAM
jgi:hypothetical protein